MAAQDYATKAELIEWLGLAEVVQRTDQSRSGSVDDGVLEAARLRGFGVVDGYLGDAGYTLPISPVPYRLKVHALALWRCELYQTSKPDYVREGCERAVKYLEAVVDGKIKLSVDTDKGATTTGAAVVARARIFDDDFDSAYGTPV